MTDARFDGTLRTAERVAALLAELGVDAVVIGALALAAHDYPRATEDLDLAVAIPPSRLPDLARALGVERWDVELRLPDVDDPLGGVIDVRAAGADIVQIVNFDNAPGGGFPRLVMEAVRHSLPLEGSSLRVADLFRLVAFKLYAGGRKSTLDVLQLLERNEVDLDGLRRACLDLGLGDELEEVLGGA